MGLFDSVYVPCASCGRMLEFQSKSGDCCMSSYELNNAPNAIKGDLVGQSEQCWKCKGYTRIRGNFHVWAEKE